MSNLTLPENSIEIYLPDKDVLAELGVAPEQYTDFNKAVQITVLQRQGMKFAKACDTVGLNIRSAYEQKWQTLMQKAMRLISGEDIIKLQAQQHKVADAWNDVVDRQLRIATSPEFEARDATAAAEFLYAVYIANQAEPPETSEQDKYLRGNPSGGFNPMAIMNTVINNVTINQVQPDKPLLPDGDVIEIEAE